MTHTTVRVPLKGFPTYKSTNLETLERISRLLSLTPEPVRKESLKRPINSADLSTSLSLYSPSSSFYTENILSFAKPSKLFRKSFPLREYGKALTPAALVICD